MSIEAGQTLQHYRLVEKLGEGGMGEVWLGRDVRLERDVAVKILPADFAANEQHLARFEREGKTISSLNHPNICTLFDIGSHGDTHYLVMERIEGESLGEHIRQKGAMTLDQVLEIGAQIASALAAAHKAGITHRDLKPDNIMLTRSGAKLLDFGLAKTASEAGPPIDGLTSLPTQAKQLTREGTILGTFQYMAPEQLEGLEADARTDIWALGAVLYEMSTGKHAFDGQSKTSLIAAIVSAQPASISSVVGSVAPRALDHVVRKCLEKDRDDRWQSASDVGEQLRWILTEGSQTGLAPSMAAPRRKRGVVPWVVASLFALLAVALLIVLVTRPGPAPAPVLRASLNPPPDTAFIPFDLLGMALSPDGERLAFVANGADGSQRLWLRELASMAAHPVPETDGASYPFWSPDGRHLGFFSDGKLRRVDLRGGSPQALADAPSGRGASWGSTDVILFAPNITTAIHRVSADGGAVEQVTPYDPERETTQRWPHFLPDGQHFFFISRVISPDRGEVGKLMLATLDDPQPEQLIDNSTNAVYVEPGYVIYGRAGDLMARPFDLDTLKFTGDPEPLVDEKLSYWEPKNFVPFAASNQGALIYLPEAARPTVLQWYDRTGRPLGTIGEPGFYATPAISPDGTKIAVVRGKRQSMQQDIWIYDLEYAREYRFTFESSDYEGLAWSPDGTRLAYGCMPQSVRNVCVKPVTGGGAAAVVYQSPDWDDVGNWTPDGKSIVITEQDPETDNDILVVNLDDPGSPKTLAGTPFTELSPRLSPDGRYLAYESDQTGRFEIYVREPRPEAQQWQISSDGGWEPRWRADGRELYYVEPDGDVVAVAIQTRPVFRASPPKVLFTLPERPITIAPMLEDVTPDGQRFLLNLPTESRASVNFHAVFNWAALVR